MCEHARMDHLKSYLAAARIKQTDFAAKVGISPSFLSDILHGNRTPSLATAGRIAEATRGKVPVSAWVARERGAA